MRTKGLLVLVAMAAVIVVTPAAARMGFEDNKLNFKSCDGKNLTARWRDTDFHLSVPGKTLNPASPDLKYLDWDGKCRTVHLNSKGMFAQTGEGASDTSPMIKYTSWDGTKWSALPSGGGFYKVYVAGEKQSVTKADVTEAARWLSVNKADSRAAERLANALTSAQ